MAQMQGRWGDSLAPGKQQLAEVHALAERLNAIGVGNGKPAAAAAADSMEVDEVIRRIKIQTLSGKTIEVYVQPTDVVARIKELLEEKEGIPPEQQRLILGGKQLVDGKTVRESNIAAGSAIHLVLALRGGRCN